MFKKSENFIEGSENKNLWFDQRFLQIIGIGMGLALLSLTLEISSTYSISYTVGSRPKVGLEVRTSLLRFFFYFRFRNAKYFFPYVNAAMNFEFF